MDEKMRKLVHNHKGVGQLEIGAGQQPIIVAYDINEYRDVISAASSDDPRATIEGLGSFQGTIRARDGSPLPFGRPDLTLHLGDGRRLGVLLTGVAGAIFDVLGTGGFF